MTSDLVMFIDWLKVPRRLREDRREPTSEDYINGFIRVDLEFERGLINEWQRDAYKELIHQYHNARFR